MTEEDDGSILTAGEAPDAEQTQGEKRRDCWGCLPGQAQTRCPWGEPGQLSVLAKPAVCLADILGCCLSTASGRLLADTGARTGHCGRVLPTPSRGRGSPYPE